MPHGERAERIGHGGREYWSRRPGCLMGEWGWYAKWRTHRTERARARQADRKIKKLAQATDPDFDAIE